MEKKVVKCSQLHFYDAGKYKTCPHCNPNAERIGQEEIIIKTEVEHHENLANKEMKEAKEININKNEDYGEKTWGVYNGTGNISLTKPPVDIENQDLDSKTDGYSDGETNGENLEQKDEVVESKDERVALTFEDTKGRTTDTKTVAFYNTGAVEPVTGWLVCIKGESVGASYNLKAGKNTIGRSIEMNVALTEEISVSREKHAIIIFDPKNSKFYVQAGETDNLSYLNDEILMTVSELKAYDKLQLGAAEFIFVPFCSDKFSWNDFIEK